MNGFPTPIRGFHISDFGDTYYQIGRFYRNFSQDTLSVFSPITASDKVHGYVLMHIPVAKVLENSYEISNFIFYAAMTVYGCSFLILITYLLYVRRPIKKINTIAGKYAKGDFSKKIDCDSNDEIGDLANTMNFMATELNTLEEEQRTFISNISHDFRSPLTSIKGYTEAMLDGTIPVEMQEKYLNIILFETERLNKLTQSILDLNQFGQNGLHLDISDFDINEVIQTTIQTFEHVCQKKSLTFHLTLTEKPLFVKGDMGKIQQVLYNLIDNATKFSHNNTAITIAASIRNGKVLISVKDSGIGIPRDSIKKIWDRFYKTDLSRGKDKRGTGLGLAIVKEIVQAHNENINVISTEGVGTEFIFTLPLSEKE
jgi:signal transduction histidine kinase